MKKVYLFIFCAVLCTDSFSQVAASPSSHVFLELAGNSGLLSLNYDRRFSNGHNGLGWRAGLGFGAASRGGHSINTALTVPVGLNYLTGAESHHLELGTGITFGSQDFSPFGEIDGNIYFVPTVGYRFQPPRKSGTFRIFLAPFLGKETEVWAGLSFGLFF